MPVVVASAIEPDPRVSFRETVDVYNEKLLDCDDKPSSYSMRLSTHTVDSNASSGSGSSFKYKNLRGGLTREQVNRDPLFFYEVTKVLGEGSMGSVKLVRKRHDKIGGSARREIQDAVKRQKMNQACLNIPVVGGLFQFCIDGSLNGSYREISDSSHRSSISISNRTFSNILASKEDLLSLSISSDSSAIDSGSTRSPESPSTDIIYAMKSIILSHVSNQVFVDELRNEIAILKSLDHPHIVRAIETFEFNKEISIIMELCSGGDLYTRDPYTEEEAARIVGSTLSAVAYMHSRKIIHRDLKFENILFCTSSGSHSEIKVIDFGLSKAYGDSNLTEGVGTIYTMAPEVLKGNYTKKADMWSIGVIAYMLLASQVPFYGRKRKEIVQQIMGAQYGFKGRKWQRISQQAKDFIGDLLVLDSEERLDADSALRSTWLNRSYAATSRAPRTEEEELARASMLRYAGYNKLKKMALMVVAHKSSSEEIGILRKVFQRYDSRRDGSISYEEFCEAMHGFGHTEKDLEAMFDAVDLDGTGRIRYTEFIAATIEAHGAISEERLAEAFDRLDCDDSGYISAENLVEILGESIPRSEIDSIIAEADITKDNRISYGEFMALWETKKDVDFEAHAGFLQEKYDPTKHHAF